MSVLSGAARGRIALAQAVIAFVFTASSAASPAPAQSTFASPERAAKALIDAAERYDVAALEEILGPDGIDLVVTEDEIQSRNLAAAFAAQAREKQAISRDPGDARRATLIVGAEGWPLPIPIVQKRGAWRFDTKAGRQEILNRRIGDNELNAIEICRGYVEAQHEYALDKHDDSPVNQYARRIVSTPGKQDGLAWRAADGTWQGPVGEGIARVIAEGYTDRYEPYHGYYFKILSGQGPSAPLGAMDFLVDGAMIGGFALVAAPADYGVTGVKTFIVSHDGVVYEKDLGSKTLEAFRTMERFDPERSWSPVETP
jgi:hypothetical protein